jgi:hypothetical protein
MTKHAWQHICRVWRDDAVRRRTRTLAIAVSAGVLLTSLGAFSAMALARTIRSAAPDCGAPAVDTIPCVESGYRDDVVQLSGNTRIGGLKFRAGDWFFVAKVVLESTNGSPDTVTCTLRAGTGVDASDAVLPPDQGNTATMEVAVSLASASSAVVRCDGRSGESAASLKITGVRAGTLFVQPIT